MRKAWPPKTPAETPAATPAIAPPASWAAWAASRMVSTASTRPTERPATERLLRARTAMQKVMTIEVTSVWRRFSSPRSTAWTVRVKK